MSGGSGHDYKTLESGTYDAMCVDIVYPIMRSYNGDKPKPCVMHVFEVNKRRVTKDGVEADSNYIAWGQTNTMMLSPKANLTALLSSWLGKPLTDGDEVNLDDFYMKSAKLMISEEQKRNGTGTFAKIIKVMPGDLEFETSSDYERKDPKDFSNVTTEDKNKENAPF